MERFAVVILNWNSPKDTIDCLRSILDGESAALPLVVDNGSHDDSITQIVQWSQSCGLRILLVSANDASHITKKILEANILLVCSKENLGFAKGCNLGFSIATALELPHTVFLNNDTIIAPRALSFLVEQLGRDPDLFATIPQVRIFGTHRIWNCGGTISRFGFRRYHFAGSDADSTTLPVRIPCSFFTGCCFAVRTTEFAERGAFTERFFFGEEDFELSLWMLDRGKRAACFTGAIVEHKVSASISRITEGSAPKLYVYYLNRFIHMRLRFGTLGWLTWLGVYMPYIALLLYRTSTVAVSELPRFMSALVRDARHHDGVDRALFMRILKAKPW